VTAPNLGLVLPLFSGDTAKVLTAAREAERLGYGGVFAFDHFFPPGAPADRPALEAFTSLAAVAAVTDRVRIGTLVTRASIRPTALIAKMAAGLDLVSGGRMILGVGTGDAIDDPEHHAFGIPSLGVEERRAHLAEAVAALKALFVGEPFRGGEWVPALPGPLVPPAVRPGGPPVWIGAYSDEVVRLAGSIGDGWNGWGMSPERFGRKAELLADAAVSAGRDPSELQATWAGIVLVGEDDAEAERLHRDRLARGMDALAFTGSVERFGSHLEELREAGATWAIVVLAGPPDRRQLIADTFRSPG
jgi:alkanesulfonate monooxygenase SsuD/methylene tetrahydromethanopterin reductase-like flavin-dependent oxidoreductase (luciferase family)